MIAIGVTGQIAHALKTEGADASENGTGRGTPIIAFSAKDYGADATNNLAPTLRAGGHTNSHQNAGVMPAVAYAFQPRIARNGRGDMGDLVNSLSAQSGETGKGDAAPCVALSIAQNQRGELRTSEISTKLTTGGGKPGEGYAAAMINSAVRRLTPRECERLQGFQFRVGPFYPGAWRDNAGRYWSPDYTAIPGAADGPRYKALGNSWAVPKFRWLGERIARFMPAENNQHF